MENGRKLSAEQQNRLAIDGYLVLPGMLSKAKIKRRPSAPL